MRLDHTRSSHRWHEKPGNWDRLNLRRIYPSTNQWGIPDIQVDTGRPARLVAYNDRNAMENPKPGDFAHFFLDDYRFETMWTLPEKSISRVARVGAALTPDFSLWSDMPLAAQLWQVYRSRWCGAWMAEHGIKIIPTVSWSDSRSYEFAFAGIPYGATVAISTVGVTDRPPFQAGLSQMIIALSPRQILIYGSEAKSREFMAGCSGEVAGGGLGVEVVHYETRWSKG